MLFNRWASSPAEEAMFERAGCEYYLNWLKNNGEIRGYGANLCFLEVCRGESTGSYGEATAGAVGCACGSSSGFW